jgi:hypothetical protein
MLLREYSERHPAGVGRRLGQIPEVRDNAKAAIRSIVSDRAGPMSEPSSPR